MSFNHKILVLAVLMACAGNTVAAELDATTVANAQLALQKAPAVGRALGLLRTGGGLSAARASRSDQFIAHDVTVDRDGTEHVRFNRSYAGLPVIGGDIVVHSRNGQLKSTSTTQRSTLSLDTRATLRSSDAIISAGSEFGSGFVGRPSAALAVYARDAAPKLVWQVAFQGFDKQGGPIDSVYIVDAGNGKVLDRWSTIETERVRGAVCLSTNNTPAIGVGKTLYSGSVAIGTTACGASFDLKDQTRGRNYVTDLRNAGAGKGSIFNDVDNVFGNNVDTDRASAATDALYGAARSWDYYKLIHGRLGINNDGVGALNRVHAGSGYANAFWSDACFCMTYGDGDPSLGIGPMVALDIAGHEISHGVTSRTAKLIYSGESGALNEANSDILGTMIEFHANNPLDTPDYLIAEKIFISNPGNTKALRWMFKPDLDGLSPNCYSSNIGKLDVHYSSGVANHFYYLLAEGSGPKTFSGVNHTSPTCNGTSLTGITRAKAEKIWYRALTVYFTSNTGYAAARAATINASNDLFGVNSIESRAVAATWSAVKVN